MKMPLILSAIGSISMLASFPLTALAQTIVTPVPVASPQVVQSQPVQCVMAPCIESSFTHQPNRITIPQSTAVVVVFPTTVAVDVEDEDQPYPLTLPLAQAILDSQGNVLIPENTPISILIQPTDQGAKIMAQSLIFNGQIIQIQAVSPVIPSATITHTRANTRAMENGAVYGRLLGSGFGFVNNGDPDQFDRGAMLGSAVGMLMGLRSSDRSHIVQIPQGSVFVLALEAPIDLTF
ncbi:MAG: hypothetical protein HY785_15800 [Oscillatoriophycideae cyanobacterium NC_groundwater_1537_Pr4_S-0.65um_50_18]|nr:hypothetical protein [Oscillatoriophycideae cyanobacterium NC_groundwater_1537_Pr4_S-0.65um_50_18]